MSQIKVEVEVELAYIRILINGLLHLCVRRVPLIGIQSYKNGHKLFVIEYQTGTTMIVSEYDKEELWEEILKGLSKVPLF